MLKTRSVSPLELAIVAVMLLILAAASSPTPVF
jgi:hypothetical protein